MGPWERREPSLGACVQLRTTPVREPREASQQSRLQGCSHPSHVLGKSKRRCSMLGPLLHKLPMNGAAWGRWRFLLHMEELR